MSIDKSIAEFSPNPSTDIARQYEDCLLTQAANDIYRSTGDVISTTDKAKTLAKFGRFDAVGTSFVTLQNEGGDETYVSTNSIDTISSSDAGDNQDTVVEGHTISNGKLTFYSSAVSEETITIDGQNKVTLPTPLARVTRLYNNGTTDFAGDIYVYEDDTVTSGVPQTASKIHMKVSEGNQSEKCSTSISDADYYIIKSFTGYCFDKATATVEFIGELRSVGTTNKVFRRVFSTAGSNGQPTTVYFDPPFIVPRNTDIRVRAQADGANTDVGAQFTGYLAKII